MREPAVDLPKADMRSGSRVGWLLSTNDGMRLVRVCPRSTEHVIQTREGCCAVKKLIALVVAVVGGLAVWRRFQQDRAERDLWTEATSASGRG